MRLSKGSKIGLNAGNMEQAIDKWSERTPYRKSHAMICVANKLTRTGKPVCTKLGLHNPPKLNLSANTLSTLKTLDNK